MVYMLVLMNKGLNSVETYTVIVLIITAVPTSVSCRIVPVNILENFHTSMCIYKSSLARSVYLCALLKPWAFGFGHFIATIKQMIFEQGCNQIFYIRMTKVKKNLRLCHVKTHMDRHLIWIFGRVETSDPYYSVVFREVEVLERELNWNKGYDNYFAVLPLCVCVSGRC